MFMPISDEILVNSIAGGQTSNSHTAFFADGTYITVWQGPFEDGGYLGIYAQRFSANGTPIDHQIKIDDMQSFSNDFSPQVAALDDGSYVVTWQGSGVGDNNGIYARKFDANNDPMGDEILVNTEVSSNQEDPSIAVLSNGEIAIAWNTNVSAVGGAIMMQRFDTSLVALGSETVMADLNVSSPARPRIEVQDDGFILLGQDASSGGSVAAFAQRFNNDLTQAGAIINVVEQLSSDQTNPEFDFFADGGYIVTWQSDNNLDSFGTGIYAQVFNADDSPSTGAILVNTTTFSTQSNPDVSVLSDGTFVITWNGFTVQSGTNVSGIVYQQFSQNGTPLGLETLATSALNTNSNQSDPHIEPLDNGGFILTWTSSSFADDGETVRGIVQRVFAAQDNTTVDQAPEIIGFTNQVSFEENIVNAAPQIIDLAVAIVDQDTPNYAGGNFSASFIQNGGSEDNLSIRNVGNGSNEIGVQGNQISYEGTVIGTIVSNGENGSDLSIDLLVGATVEAMEALIENLQYQNTSQSPELQRTLSIRLQDANGNSNSNTTTQIEVVANNDSVPAGGDSTVVNTFSNNVQQSPDIAAFDDGSYVVVWQSYSQNDEFQYGIHAQRYSNDGTPIGIEMQINQSDNLPIDGSQTQPTVATFSDGSYMIAWQGPGAFGDHATGIYGRIFNADGTPVTDDFRLNEMPTGNLNSVDLIRLSNGNVAATWSGSTIDDSSGGIAVRVFDSSGNAVTGDIVVNETTSSNQYIPSVDAYNGGFVITWTSSGQIGGSSTDVVARQLNNDGTFVAGEIDVTLGQVNNQDNPQVVAYDDGSFVLVWTDNGGADGSSDGVFARRFDAIGNALTEQVQINEFTNGNQNAPQVALLDNGNLAITWTNTNQNFIVRREFTSDLRAVDSELQVESNSAFNVAASNIAHIGNNEYVVVFQASGGGLNNTDIIMNRFGTFNQQNDPVIRGYASEYTLNEADVNAGFVQIDLGVSVIDTDSNDFDNAELFIGYNVGGTSDDQLQIMSQGNGVGQVNVSGTDIFFEGSLVGSISQNGLNGQALVIQLNALANAQTVESILENLAYANTSNSPLTGRSVSIRITDGDGGASQNLQFGINLTLENDSTPINVASAQVNTFFNREQYNATGQAFDDGSYVVVWQSLGQTNLTNISSIHGQKFNAQGQPIGIEFSISEGVPGSSNVNDVNPSVVTFADGSFLVAWTGNGDDDSSDIVAQRFNADGSKNGGEFQLNETNNSQDDVQLARLSDGNFIVTWQTFNLDGSSLGVAAKIFQADGTALTSEFQVNTSASGVQYRPDVGTYDGGFAIAWQSQGQAGFSNYQTVMQRYANDGTTVGSEQQITSTDLIGAQEHVAIATQADGSLIAVWQTASSVTDGSSSAILAQRYDASGNALGDSFVVNELASGGQILPDVAFLPNGNFVVTWEDGGQIERREFDSNAQALDGDQLVNINEETSTQTSPSIIMLENGSYSILFRSNQPTDGDSWGTFQSVYGAPTTSDNPVLAGLSSTITFAEADVNSAPQILDAAVALSDSDSSNFEGGQLSLGYIQNGSANDQLGINNQGGGNSQIGVVGNQVTYSGTVIGTLVQDGQNGNALVVTFTSAATQQAVEALVQNLTYANNSQAPITERLLAINIEDGDGGASGSQIINLQIDSERDGTPSVFGPEQVNTYTVNTQNSAAVGSFSDGSYVVAWTSFSQDDSSGGIYMQRYDANGVQVGRELQVAQSTIGNQFDPVVTVLTDGTYIVAWDGQGITDNDGVFARRFDANGEALGDEFTLRDTNNSSEDGVNVAALSDGNFVATWAASSLDGSTWGIAVRIFAPDGTAIDDTFVANTTTSNVQYLPKISSHDTGFIISWYSNSQANGDSNDIVARQFNNDGSAASDEINVFLGEGSQTLSAVAAYPDGSFVVVFESSDTNSNGIFAQRFDASGVAQGDLILVNETVIGSQSDPSVTVLANGNFVVAWSGAGIGGDSNDAYVREYSASGIALDGEILVSSTSSSTTNQAVVSQLGNGNNYIVVYSDSNIENTGNGLGIFQNIFGDALDFNRSGQLIFDDLTETRTLLNTESSIPVRIDADIDLSAQGVVDFTNATVEVYYLTPNDFDDTLGIDSSGSGDGQIQVSGSNILYSGVIIGQIDGSENGATGNALRVSLNSNASIEGVQALVEHLNYSSQNDVQNNETIAIRITDTNGVTSSRAVNIVIANSISTPNFLIEDVDRQVTFEQADVVGQLSTLDSNINFEYNGPNSLEGGRLTLDYIFANGTFNDTLGVASAGTGANQISVNGDQISFEGNVFATIDALRNGQEGNNLTINFNTGTTEAAVEALIEALSYGTNFGLLNDRTVRLYILDSANAFSSNIDYTISITPETNPTQLIDEITLVNQYTPSSQIEPAADALANGGYVVAWESQGGQDGNGTGIFAQRFNDQGQAIGNEFVVNTESFSNQTQPAVVGLADGSFVISWTSRVDESNSDINVYGQRFDANGEMLGGQFIINELLGSSQFDSNLEALPSGGFVAVYTTNDASSGDNNGTGVAMRYFDANGNPTTGEILVNQSIAGAQTKPSVAVTDNAVMVTWKNATGDDVQARIFNLTDGTELVSEFKVNTTENGDIWEEPTLTALDDGSFLVVWGQRITDFGGNFWGFRGQKIGSDGALIGDEFIVNSEETSWTVSNGARIVTLNNGNVVISWGASLGIYTQEFDVSFDTPALVASPVLAGNGPSTDHQQILVELGANSASLIWSGFNTGATPNSTYEIAQQIIGNPSDFSPQSRPVIENLPEQITLIESTSEQLLFTAIDVLDTDSPNFDGGALYLDAIAGYLDNENTDQAFNGDNWGIQNQGNGVGQISVSGDQVLFEGVQIGTIVRDGQAGNGLQVNFNANATPLAVTALVQSVTYSSSSTAPLATRDLALRITDGDGASNMGQSFTLNITPVIDGFSPQTEVFQVNSYELGGQITPTMAELSDGSYVIAWVSDTAQDGSAAGIFAQRYGANGAPIGNEFNINSTTLSSQNFPQIVANGTGFVAVWESNSGQDGSGFAVVARRFDNLGEPIGDEFIINETTSSTQRDPSAVELANGGFAVVWEGNGTQTGNTDANGIFIRLYDVSGNATSSELLVSVDNAIFSQEDPSITQLSDGKLAVSYRDGNSITIQLLNQDGSINSPSFFVPDSGNTEFEPSITALTGGGFVVTYTTGDDGSSWGVLAQIYANNGVALGEQFRVNEGTSSFQYQPQVSALSNGGFVITFTDNAGGDRIYTQEYNARGDLVDGNNQVNQAFSTAYQPAVLGLSAGGYAVAWSAFGLEASNNNTQGVFARLYGTDGQFNVDIGGLELAGLSEQITVQESDTPVNLFASVDLFNAQSNDFNGGSLTISVIEGYGVSAQFVDSNTQDNFSIENQGDGAGQIGLNGNAVSYQGVVIGTLIKDGNNGQELQIDFNPAADQDTINALIQAVTYLNSSQGPSAERTISLRLSDANGATTANNAITLSVTPEIDGASAQLETIQVNAFTDGDQVLPQVTELEDGSFVVVWQSAGQDGWGNGIVGQRFDAAGSPLGNEFVVNQYTPTEQGLPNVAAINGGFVVTWEGRGENDSSGVFARSFDLNGVATSNDFSLSDTLSSRQFKTDVTELNSGGFAVVFQGNGAGDSDGVYLRIFDANNNPVGAEILVNTVTLPSNEVPSITQLANGNIVVSWHESSDVKAQIFGADGTRISPSDIVVASSSDTEFDSSVAALSGGGFVITYTDVNDGSNYGVFAQRYDENGLEVGEAFRVNENVTGFQYLAEVTGTENGGFAVTFYDSNNGQVFVQQYDANAAIIDDTIIVDSYVQNSEFNPSITSLNAGGFVVVYSNQNAEADTPNSQGIFMRLFGADGQFTTSAAPIVEIAQSSIEFTETSLNFAPQTLFIGAGVADGDSSDFDGGQLQVSRTSSYGQGDQLGRQGFFPQDNLAIQNQGNGAGEIAVSGSNVLYAGVVIGIVESSGANDTPLVVTFNANASAQAIESLIEAITYRNISDAPETTRSYSLRLTDGDGGASIAQQIEVNVTQNLDGNLPTLQPERIVNSESTGNQQWSQTSALYDEGTGDLAGYVVVWEDSNTNQAKFQLYDANNNPVGDETLISTTLGNDQERPSVQALNNGTFVVSWYASGEDGSGDGIIARIFNNDGTTDANAAHGGDQFIVNSFISSSQLYPDIAVLESGEFAIVWQSSDNANGDNSSAGISLQRFTEDGQAIGGETLVNTVVLGQQSLPSIASLDNSTALPDGGYVVTWLSPDTSSTGVFAQVIDAQGNAVGTEFQVNSTTLNTQNNVSVAGLNNGDFVVTWDDNSADLSGLGVYAQRFSFDGDGTPVAIGLEFRVNSEYISSQSDPEITALSTGGFAISYSGIDSNGSGIYVQEFDAAGRLIDLPQLVNQQQSNTQHLSHIAAVNDGGYIVTWTSFEDNVVSNEIGLQRFGNQIPTTTDFVVQGIEDEDTAIDPNEFINAFVDPENEALQSVAIITLPISGVLQLNGVNITAGQVLNIVDLLNGDLQYIGDPNFNGVDSFTWSGSDGVSFAEPSTTNISILPVNDAPAMDVGEDDIGFESFSSFNSLNHVITFGDPDGDVLLVDVDWGDGSNIQRYTTSSNTLNTSHRYLDDGVYTVTVTVDDQSGNANAVETQSYQATINNVAPSMSLFGSNTVEQDDVYTLRLGNPSDPGDDTVTEFIVDWGDGNVETFNSAGDVTHVYATADDYVITVDLVDEDGTYTDVASKNVQVSEPAEVLDILPIEDTTADEGSFFIQAVSITDPTDQGSNGWTYDIDWGDGTVQTGVRVFNRDFNIGHTFADDGTYDVQITVRDDDGSQLDTEDFQVVVGDIAPRLNLSGAGSVSEGNIYFLSGSLIDPGTDTVTEYVIDWGDGTVETIAGPNFGTQQHLYADGPFGYDITVTATNEDVTDLEVATAFVNVLNVAPTSTITGPTELDEGTEYTFTFGDIVDPGQDTITATVIDWGDGTTTEYTGPGEYSHTFSDGDATRAIQLLVSDEDAAPHSAASLVVDVNDVDPALTISGPSEVNEGSVYTLTLSDLVEPGDDPITEIQIDWGDGSAIELVNGLGSYQHVYADGDENVTISVSLVNDDNLFDVGSIDVLVNNVAPDLPISGAPTAIQGEEYTLSLGDIIDPGIDNIVAGGIEVIWGDGTIETFDTIGDVSHTYTELGDFTISINITDEDGAFFDVASLNVTVEPPAATVNVAAQIDETLNEGDTFTRTIEFTDEEDNGAAGRTVEIDWNDDGTIDQSFTLDSSATSFDISNLFADGDAVNTVAVTVTDDTGESDTERFDVTVNNVAPTSTITGPTELDEGTEYVFTLGEVLDPGQDSISNAQIDWGDGNFSTYTGAGDYAHTFADGDSASTIRLLVTDEDGTFTAASLAVNVNDVTPSLTLSGDNEVNEGSEYILTLSDLVEPGDDPVTEYLIDWGDGSPVQSVSDLGDVSHTYADGDALYDISVNIVNDDGTFLGANKTVTVNNVAPTLNLSGAATGIQNTPYTLALGAVIDPGLDTIVTNGITVDWGDGTVETFDSVGDIEHVYAAAGDYTISVSLEDEDGVFANVATQDVEIVVPASTVDIVAQADATLNEGDTFTRTIEFTDEEDNGAAGRTVEIDWNDDGTIDQSFTLDSSATSFDISNLFADGDAVNTVAVTVTDDTGESDTERFDVTVNNVAPVASISGNTNVAEGDTYTLTLGDIVDPGSDTINSATIVWGDGTSTEYTGAGEYTHVYGDGDADFTIQLSVSDEDGDYIAASLPIMVDDVAPNITVIGDNEIDEGSEYILSLSDLVEPGDDAVSEYIIDWGDGTPSTTVNSLGDVAHIYADGLGAATIAVSIISEGQIFEAGTVEVVINNVAPDLDILGSPTSIQNELYTLNLGEIVDPGQDTIVANGISVDWGDGTVTTYNDVGNVTHNFSLVGDYVISVSLEDEDGVFENVASLAVSVTAPVATVSIPVQADETLNEGDTFTRTIVLEDQSDDGDAGWTVELDWDGDGITDETFTTLSNSFDISQIIIDGNDSIEVGVRVTDIEGESDSESFTLNVNNVAPEASILFDSNATAGQAYTISLGDIVDPGDDTVTSAVINWGDGTSSVYTGAGDYSHTYIGDILTPTITLDVTDEDGTFVAAQADVTVTVEATPPSATGSIDESILRDEQAQLSLNIDSQEQINEIIVDWGDGTVESFADASALLHTYGDTGFYDVSVQLVTDSGTYDVGVVDDIDVGFRVGDASTYYNFFNPNEWQEAWTDQDLQLSHRANTANDAEVWSAMSFTGWVSWILSGTDVAFGMLGVSGISNYTGGYYQHLDGAEGIRADVEDAYNGQIDFSDLFSNEFGSADESARIQVFAEDGTLIDEFMVSGDDDGVVSYSFSTANAFSHIVINAGAYDENGNFIYGSYAQDNGLAIASLPGTGSELLLSAMQFGYRAAESISVATAATANDAGTSNEVAPNEAEFDFTGIDEVSIDIYEKGAKQISTSVPKTVVSDDASVSEGSHQEYINQELDFSSTEQSNVVMSTDQLVYQKIYGANQNTASIVSSDAETLAIVDLDFMHIDDDPFDLSGVGDYLIK